MLSQNEGWGLLLGKGISKENDGIIYDGSYSLVTSVHFLVIFVVGFVVIAAVVGGGGVVVASINSHSGYGLSDTQANIWYGCFGYKAYCQLVDTSTMHW